MKLLKKFKEGFTLVELVVVIAVIAILAGVSVATYVGITNNAKQSTANQEASTLKTLIMTEAVKTYDGKTYDIVYEAEDAIVVKGADAAISAATLAAELDDLVANAQNVTLADIENADSTTTPKAILVSVAEQKNAVGYYFEDGSFKAAKAGNKEAEAVTAPKDEFKVKLDDDMLVLTHTNGKKADVIKVTYQKA